MLTLVIAVVYIASVSMIQWTQYPTLSLVTKLLVCRLYRCKARCLALTNESNIRVNQLQCSSQRQSHRAVLSQRSSIGMV